METKPTYEQAQLHLQVYDLRREARLRQARDWFFKNYIVLRLPHASPRPKPSMKSIRRSIRWISPNSSWLRGRAQFSV